MANSISFHDVAKVTIARDTENHWTTLVIEFNAYGYNAEGEYAEIVHKTEIALHHTGTPRLKIRTGAKS